MDISNTSVRAREIGCSIFVEDAVNYNVATVGKLAGHPPCVAIENTGTADLTVGLTMPSSDGWQDFAVTLVPSGQTKSHQSVREFKLTAVTPSYSTKTLSWTAVANTYYLVLVNSLDAPSATTTITAAENKGTVENFNKSLSQTAITVTKKGVTGFLFKTTDTSPSVVLGDGFSAHNAATTPTFKVYTITAWALQELNIVY